MFSSLCSILPAVSSAKAAADFIAEMQGETGLITLLLLLLLSRLMSP